MIELADVISELRDELDRARRTADGAELRFELGAVELEVTVALDREGKTGGKVTFWVAEATAAGKLSSKHTQRVKLTLQPTLTLSSAQDSGVSQATVRPATVYIGGNARDGER